MAVRKSKEFESGKSIMKESNSNSRIIIKSFERKAL